MDRIVRYEQLHPNVAVAVKRVTLGWLIVVNPGLSRAARRVAVAQAEQYADAFEMGWAYVPPVGGVDVCIEESFMSVAAVLPEQRRPSPGVAIAAAFGAVAAASSGIVAHLVAAGPVVGA